MINPKNKRVQVTLPGESVELLESLSIRYHKTNSEIVKWAINVLAARKRHNIVIKLSEQTKPSDHTEEQNLQNDDNNEKLRKRFEEENIPEEDQDKYLIEHLDEI